MEPINKKETRTKYELTQGESWGELVDGQPNDFYMESVMVIDDNIEEDGLPKDFDKLIEMKLLANGFDV